MRIHHPSPASRPLFGKQPPWAVLAFGHGLLALVCAFDWGTPPDVDAALFYLMPAAVVTWFAGRRFGMVMAVTSTAAWLLLNLAGGFPRPAVAKVNAVSHLVFFMVVVSLLSAWKAAGRRLEAKVEKRTAALTAEVREHSRAKQAVRDLGAQLAATEDAERRRLAHDIHDTMGQMLSLVKLNIEAAASAASQSSAAFQPVIATPTPVASEVPAATPTSSAPPVAKESPAARRLAEAVRLVDDLIRQTRTMILDLHPAMLDDLGLGPTLHWYAEQFGRQTGADVTISEQGESRPLPPTQGHYLFRAMKEVLNNALKHGRAKEIIVMIHWQPDALRVVIDDDGGGFDPAAVLGRQPGRGLGLPAIRERLTSLGGKLHVESRTDEGTRVILELPIVAGFLVEAESGPNGGKA